MNNKYCPLCERDNISLTKHHLRTVNKAGQNSETEMVCEDCHDQIHALFTNTELRDTLNTVSSLKEHPQMRKFFKFIRKKPAGSFVRTKMSKRKR